MSAIHASRLVHRDLKPANIVCDNGVPLIADFGSVRQLAEGQTDLPASGHSPLYRPPESFSTNLYGIQGDVYQVGIISYQLLGGKLPYDPLEYFSKSDKTSYASVIGDFDKSKFQDNVIHGLAASSRLLNFNTLPPWIGAGAKSALRSMINPAVNQRLGNMADVAAALTRVRSDTKNWGWAGEIATLEKDDRRIELRPIGDGLFEPMQAKGDIFRRIPSLSNGPLRDLVKKLS